MKIKQNVITTYHITLTLYNNVVWYLLTKI